MSEAQIQSVLYTWLQQRLENITTNSHFTNNWRGILDMKTPNAPHAKSSDMCHEHNLSSHLTKRRVFNARTLIWETAAAGWFRTSSSVSSTRPLNTVERERSTMLPIPPPLPASRPSRGRRRMAPNSPSPQGMKNLKFTFSMCRFGPPTSNSNSDL